MSKITSLSLLIFSILFLFACGGDAEEKDKKTIFRYNQPNAVTSLDPAFARNQSNIWATNHLFNSLVQLDDDLNVKLCIARRYSISKDGLTYTFTLRDDVYFHDNDVFPEGKGRKVIASDFVYSFNRIIDKEVNSPGAWIFNERVTETEPFKAINDTTFVVTLAKPFRPMLGIFTMQYCSVVPKEAIDKYGKEFRKNPVGTGAFVFKRWVENQALILLKNEKYFEREAGSSGERLPVVDGIRVTFLSERKTAYLDFEKGNTDFMSGLESSFVDQILTKSGTIQEDKKDKITLSKAPYLNSEYLGILMNFEGDKMKNNPLKIKEVRQALNYGFDREKMLLSLRNNIGKPATSGFTPRGLPSFDASKVKGYTYDADKARKLLEKAGFPNGKGFPEIKLKTNKDYLDICTYITRQWEDLGIKISVEVMESATLRQLMSKGEASLFRASWIADYPDAESFFTCFYSKNTSPPNYTQFKNAAFDTLYEQALNENDNEKRYALYQSMDKILIEEAPVIFLFYDETARFSQKNVRGLSNNALNLLSVKRVNIMNGFE